MSNTFLRVIWTILVLSTATKSQLVAIESTGENIAMTANDVVLNLLSSKKISLQTTLDEIRSQGSSISSLTNEIYVQQGALNTQSQSIKTQNQSLTKQNQDMQLIINQLLAKVAALEQVTITPTAAPTIASRITNININNNININIDIDIDINIGINININTNININVNTNINTNINFNIIMASTSTSNINTANATTFGSGMLPGDIRLVQCKPGYSVDGTPTGALSQTVVCGADLTWSDQGTTTCSLIPVETVTCCLTFDNYVREVFADGIKLTVAGGGLGDWPAVKRVTFLSTTKVLGIHGGDAERGCLSGFFSMSCNQPSRQGRWNLRTDITYIDQFEVHTEKQNPNPSWDTGTPRLWATVGDAGDELFAPSFTADNSDTAVWKQSFQQRIVGSPDWAACGAHSNIGSFCGGTNAPGPTDWFFKVYPAR